MEARRPTYGEGTLEGNLVALDGLNGGIGNGGLAILKDGVDVDGLPGNGGLVLSVSRLRVGSPWKHAGGGGVERT